MGDQMNRRSFIKQFTAGLAMASLSKTASTSTNKLSRPNILLITADDMNWDAPGVYGCKIPDITPNIDKLAAEGIRFEQAHVTIAVCQPSRSVLMTGRYPQRNGAMGFEPIFEDVPTLQEQLRAAGYLNGILGKVKHLAPASKFPWDTIVGHENLGEGRNPAKYYAHCKEFFEMAKAADQPFFLMVNSHDPHRPFAGSEQEKRKATRATRKMHYPKASKYYQPDEVVVPEFLPDLPDIRKEIAQYYTSVHRCDEIVGEVLGALTESGFEENTLVMFLSDNGMAFPFAKTNCYLNSTRTPWIVRWPGRIEPGTLDDEHFISGIDFMPTILEAAGLEQVADMDGRSFLSLLRGEPQPGRELVFTVFHTTSAKRDYPMRCLQNRKYGYIFNAWPDGKTVFLNESQSGLTFKAMQAASGKDEKIAARVKLFQYRVPEEFYYFENDPNALNNLIDDPQYKNEIQKMRKAMLEIMKSTRDPLLEAFEVRTR